MSSLHEKRRNRGAFMRSLYDATDGVELELVDMYSIGDRAGLSLEATNKAVEYLVGEGLVEFAALGGVIRITHFGVVEVEELVGRPDRPTQHFTPIDGPGATAPKGTHERDGSETGAQVRPDRRLDFGAIRSWVDLVDARIPGLALATSDRTHLQSELATIRAQLGSPRPRESVIRDALDVIQNLLIGIEGNAAAAALLDQLPS